MSGEPSQKEDSSNLHRRLRSNTDRRNEPLPPVLERAVEKKERKKQKSTLHQQKLEEPPISEEKSEDSADNNFLSAEEDSIDVTFSSDEENHTTAANEDTEARSPTPIHWEQNYFNFSLEYFTSPGHSPPASPKVYRPRITVIMADSKADLSDDRDILTRRVKRVQDTLDAHTATPPVLITLEQIEVEIDEVQEVKKEIDQLQKRTPRLFRTDTDVERGVAMGLDTALLDAWKKTAIHANQIKTSLQSKKKSRVKLETEPPTFDGQALNWPSFLDQFNSKVVTNNDIDPTDKLCLLKKCLEKGSASHIVKNFPLTVADWDNAWAAVRRRYDHQRELAYATLAKLFELTPITQQTQDGIRNIIDITNGVLLGLDNQKVDTKNWDLFLNFMVRKNLDNRTRTEFEKSLPDDSFHDIQVLLDYLGTLATALGTAVPSQPKLPKPNSNGQGNNQKQVSAQATAGQQQVSASSSVASSKTTKKSACAFCTKGHWNSACPTLTTLTPQQRKELATSKRLCLNCLGFSTEKHKATTCSRGSCGLNGCRSKHHQLLHSESVQNTLTTVGEESAADVTHTAVEKTTVGCHPASNDGHPGGNVLLATAVINILCNGKTHKARALIDQGSQINMITEKLANRLQLRRKPDSTLIKGIGNSKSNTARGVVSVQIQSQRDPTWAPHINCYVLPIITGDKPKRTLDIKDWVQFTNLKLADAKFNETAPIDILLGVQVFIDILGTHHIKGTPSAIDTKLGYLLMGEVDVNGGEEPVSALTCDVDFDLARFWIQEEVPQKSEFSPEEREVEDHYARTHARTEEGRFIVELPFKPEHKPLGESRSQALRRLYQLEKRLEKNPDKRELYHGYMRAYFEDGKLIPISIPNPDLTDDLKFYLPHHFVEKDSTSTKFRVVFDGSAKSTTGLSLNDIIFVGPTLQPDLVTTLLKFREHEVVFSADIKKMYLQVGVFEKHQDFLRVLWRDNRNEPVREYKFTCVVFGLGSSPYLALKSLHQLAETNKEELPLGAEALANDFYVDDCLSGADSTSEALRKQKQLIEITRRVGFHICKWSSNNSQLLEEIPVKERETKLPLEFNSTDKIKTLGILWDPASDQFSFKTKQPADQEFKKRKVASYAAKTYDPTGLIQPVIIKSKIILQQLWESRVDWDDPIPPEIANEWKTYVEELPELEKIRIPRNVRPNNPESISIHGFSDASKKAIGAVIYVVGESDSGRTSRLLTSKSKVTPLKMVTMPRLELMGGVLLVKLVKSVSQSLRTNFTEMHYWSDSSIVLHQISKPSRNYKTFVGNRVSCIQENSDETTRHYVKTTENPADLVSRGMSPSELANSSMWWNGPDWLTTGNLPIVPIPGSYTSDPDELPKVTTLTTTTDTENWAEETISRFSSLIKLKRVTVFILRRLNPKLKPQPRNSTLMTVPELNIAMTAWIKITQAQHFEDEIKWLGKNQEFPNGNTIKSLNPFLDAEGVLQVGGRLDQADDIPEDMKHPTFLPKNHPLVKLIVQDTHDRYKHAGAQLMASIISASYWVIGLKHTIKRCIKNCITCQKVAARIGKQMMGNLPKARISQTRAFLHTGVDYAGPIQVLPKTGRGQHTMKCWISVFVCFTTKAVHLELVSELSTRAFIAALKRFASRRGKPEVLYSDEGTNFTGSKNEMTAFHEEMLAIANHHDVARSLAEDGITWKLNPPGAPHMGGLWEAAVKSVKYHLRRCTDSNNFTIEELTTLLCEIEACLNSRPLTQMSNDPSDFSVLTPGHFLIGEPLAAVPGPDLTSTKMNRLDRFQRIQQQTTHFWNRWSQEYLHTLQNRPKWLTASPNFKVGGLVIIKDESMAPTKWKTGRITKVNPGADGKVRVATVKTATTKIIPFKKGMKPLEQFQVQTSEIKRPIHKLVRLPYDEGEPHS